MGASRHLRWVTIVVAAWLVAAVPAGAEKPASPDAAPTASHAPQPDPAPVKTTPKAAIVVRPAPRPVARATTTIRPAAPAAATPTPARAASKPVRRATTRHKTTVRRKARAHTPASRPHVAVPPLPHLSLARLTAPSTTSDAGRARKLAAGALSLLILALASATLLAFTARVERRRVVR
jgi:hypothetical protein